MGCPLLPAGPRGGVSKPTLELESRAWKRLGPRSWQLFLPWRPSVARLWFLGGRGGWLPGMGNLQLTFDFTEVRPRIPSLDARSTLPMGGPSCASP